MTDAATTAYEHLRTKAPDSAKIPDFLLGVILPIPIILPVVQISANVASLAVVILLASVRRPLPEDKMPWWAPALVVAMIGWVAVSMAYNGLASYSQFLYFAAWALSILAFASGRLDRVSICRGLGVGLALGALAGLASRFAGIGPNNYAGRLTGYVWNDPNQAGYFLTVLTALALVGLRPGWRRWGALAAFSACIVLTLSRTSLVAMAVGAIWFLVRRKVSPALGLSIAGVAAYFLQGLSERYKTWGPFAERGGSDALRDRIDGIAAQMVEIHPWIGRGPGTAQLIVEGRPFFFHNAYLAVRNNGGWILLALLLLLILLAAIQLLRLPPEQHHPWHEAALIALLICAASLGEAFLRAPAALAIGLALRHAINPSELRSSDRDETSDHVL